MKPNGLDIDLDRESTGARRVKASRRRRNLTVSIAVLIPALAGAVTAGGHYLEAKAKERIDEVAKHQVQQIAIAAVKEKLSAHDQELANVHSRFDGVEHRLDGIEAAERNTSFEIGLVLGQLRMRPVYAPPGASTPSVILSEPARGNEER